MQSVMPPQSPKDLEAEWTCKNPKCGGRWRSWRGESKATWTDFSGNEVWEFDCLYCGDRTEVHRT